MTRVSYKPLGLFKTSSCNSRKRGCQRVICRMKGAELDRLTYSTNDLLTLSDALGFEHHTTEACWRRGFWGVSVERANGLLGSCHLNQSHHSCVLHHCLQGSDPHTKQGDCKPPMQKKSSCLLCLAGDWCRISNCVDTDVNTYATQNANIV